MLNRRHLRIKVMQALYAFFHNSRFTKSQTLPAGRQGFSKSDINLAEKELLLSIEKVHDLYIYLLLLITEIANFAWQYAELSKKKQLPTEEDLSPNPKFINNRFIKQLTKDKEFKGFIESKRLSWSGDPDLVKNIFLQIKSSDEYARYLASSEDSYNTDKQFIITIFKMHIADFSPLRQFLEQKSIFWTADMELVNHTVLRTIKTATPPSEGVRNPSDLPSSKGREFKRAGSFLSSRGVGSGLEDHEFSLTLFRKTILHEKKYEKLIGKKAKNWEMERIAMMDILLMKMAMCEILEFPTVPVKVSLNEYIEIAKQYSTPRSNIFINGILDKLVADFRKSRKIKKTGRGLVN